MSWLQLPCTYIHLEHALKVKDVEELCVVSRREHVAASLVTAVRVAVWRQEGQRLPVENQSMYKNFRSDNNMITLTFSHFLAKKKKKENKIIKIINSYSLFAYQILFDLCGT